MNRQRKKIVANYRKIRRRLRRSAKFSDEAARFLAEEVRNHHSGNIDIILVDKWLKIFQRLAIHLGPKTKVKLVRPKLRLSRDTIILHAQEIAFGRKCLDDVRTRMIDRRIPLLNRQFASVAVALIASRHAIEIDGVPVVSLSNGCPSCNTRLSEGK